ncbi:glycosyl hydrolase family 8 [Acerihabitans sp. KWT182]|uniref:cellulase n=1 Tax=Acerihabitans sp. KWT182 TaxID=3157919 RepID=A0AAU7Q663_9GAMM
MSNQIQTALLNHAVISYGDYTVMLPGIEGFEHNDRLTLNPSYFIFPAWYDFYQYSHNETWQKLIDSSMVQLTKMDFGEDGLPTDWVDLDQNGQFSPAAGWPSRFSFDAVRIPLYLRWAGISGSTLSPFIKHWSKSERDSTPAWIDVVKNQTAEYSLSQGMLAVRDLTLDDKQPISGTIGQKEDYYSASLHLLSYYVQNQLSHSVE